MLIDTFTNGRRMPTPLSTMQYSDPRSRKNLRKGVDMNSQANHPSEEHQVFHGSSLNGKSKFQNAYAACNFIVTWNGETVEELFEAIRCARESQDRFIQDKLIEYILNIPFRNPRPSDIPAFVGKPVWAVDKHGHALVGMPGSEAIVGIESLRSQSRGRTSNGQK